MPDDSASIQGALDAAPETVLVRPGEYAETPIARRPVVLGRLSTTLEAGVWLDGIEIEPHSNTGSYLFEGLGSRTQVVIRNDIVRAACTIQFSSCSLTAGVFESSERTDVAQIAFIRCSLGGYTEVRTRIAVEVDSCLIQGRLRVTGDLLGLSIRDCIFEGTGNGAAISAGYIGSVNIERNAIRNYSLGISAGTDGVTRIADNVIEDCTVGGLDVPAASVVIQDNVIRRCGFGLGAASNSQLIVSGNRIEQCTGTGAVIEVGGLWASRIAYNQVSHCGGDGVVVGGSIYEPLAFEHNTIACCNGTGVLYRIDTVSDPGTVDVVANLICRNAGYGIMWLTAQVTNVACNDLIQNQLNSFQ